MTHGHLSPWAAGVEAGALVQRGGDQGRLRKLRGLPPPQVFSPIPKQPTLVSTACFLGERSTPLQTTGWPKRISLSLNSYSNKKTGWPIMGLPIFEPHPNEPHPNGLSNMGNKRSKTRSHAVASFLALRSLQNSTINRSKHKWLWLSKPFWYPIFG